MYTAVHNLDYAVIINSSMHFTVSYLPSTLHIYCIWYSIIKYVSKAGGLILYSTSCLSTKVNFAIILDDQFASHIILSKNLSVFPTIQHQRLFGFLCLRRDVDVVWEVNGRYFFKRIYDFLRKVRMFNISRRSVSNWRSLCYILSVSCYMWICGPSQL